MVNLVDLHTLPDRKQQQEIELPPNGTSLDLLRAVYHNPNIPLPTRMRAAGLALNYEHPRLMVQAQVSENDFASLLERAIKRTAEMENGRTKLIEVQPAETTRPNVEVRPVKSHTVDRRYRRV